METQNNQKVIEDQKLHNLLLKAFKQYAKKMKKLEVIPDLLRWENQNTKE
jgi:hypothetical protein